MGDGIHAYREQPLPVGATLPPGARQKTEKPDPYATPFHRSLDALLIVLTLLLFAFLLRSGERGQDTADSESNATRVQLDSRWAKAASDPRIATNTRPLEHAQH